MLKIHVISTPQALTEQTLAFSHEHESLVTSYCRKSALTDQPH